MCITYISLYIYKYIYIYIYVHVINIYTHGYTAREFCMRQRLENYVCTDPRIRGIKFPDLAGGCSVAADSAADGDPPGQPSGERDSMRAMAWSNVNIHTDVGLDVVT